MCIAEKKGYVLPPSSPAAAEALQLLAVVQALEREHLDAKSQLPSLKLHVLGDIFSCCLSFL